MSTPPAPRTGVRAMGRVLHEWAHTAQARAVRDGMLWLVPYLMVWTTFLVVAEVARVQRLDHWLLRAISDTALAMREGLPFAIWGTMGSMLAVQARLPRAPVAFVAVAAGLLVGPMLRTHNPGLLSLQVPLAIVGPLILVPLVVRLGRTRAGGFAGPAPAAGHNVSTVLNLVFPAIGAVLLLMLGLAGLLEVLARLPAWPSPHSELPPLLIAALYCVLNSLLWSVGIHGFYALWPLLDWLPSQPSAQEPLSQAFLGVFVFIGGSGGTASLIVVLLLFARERKHRLIAAFSVLPGLLNVNELLLFGLPLILNRHLFWPFLAVPLINLSTAVLTVQLGWVPAMEVNIPFNGLLLLNAWLGSGGPTAAPLLQLFNIALGAAIYAPFVRRFEAGERASERIPLKALETSYARRREEADLMLDDPVAQGLDAQQERQRLRTRLQALDEGEFLLHYQAKVAPATGQVVSCEALLRLDQGGGKLRYPGDFLADLHRAGLMREVDLWVLQAAVDQVHDWQDQGMAPVSVAVNMSVDTLGDPRALKACTRLIARCPWALVIEITEQALVGDEAETRAAIAALKHAGATVHVDDFGTGFSSLSYLHRFDIDGIKIDRSFTLSLGSERGRCVFAALCSLAEALKLDVVVEGVEQPWQLAQLRPLPSQQALTVQGWIYARALPPDAFLTYRQAHAG